MLDKEGVKNIWLKFFGKSLYLKAFFRHSTLKNFNVVKNLWVEYFYIYIHIGELMGYTKKLQIAAHGQFVLVFNN